MRSRWCFVTRHCDNCCHLLSLLELFYPSVPLRFLAKWHSWLKASNILPEMLVFDKYHLKIWLWNLITMWRHAKKKCILRTISAATNVNPVWHYAERIEHWGRERSSCCQPLTYPLLMISSTSGLIRGSPPVRRIFSTPSWTKRLASFRISEVDSSWLRGVSFTPSSGIQYWPENRENAQTMQSTAFDRHELNESC